MRFGVALVPALIAAVVFAIAGLVVAKAAPSTVQWTAGIVCGADQSMIHTGSIPGGSPGERSPGGDVQWFCVPKGSHLTGRALPADKHGGPTVTQAPEELAAGLCGVTAFGLIFLTVPFWGANKRAGPLLHP